MPTTYSHYYFGNEVFLQLAEPVKKLVSTYRDLYDIGVHGPDIFFYYKLLKHNDINDYGSQVHYLSGREFFEKAKAVFQQHDNKNGMMVYLLGFFSHYSFDSFAHSYIEIKKEISGVSHNKIEAAYDSYLITKSGYDWKKYSRVSSIKPSKAGCELISRFFDIDGTVVYKSLKSQVLILDLIRYKNRFWHCFVRTVMKLINISSNTQDILIDGTENEKCADSNLRLDKIRDRAKSFYLHNYQTLIDYFDHNFCFTADYKNIPVLNLEDEKNYILEGE